MIIETVKTSELPERMRHKHGSKYQPIVDALLKLEIDGDDWLKITFDEGIAVDNRLSAIRGAAAKQANGWRVTTKMSTKYPHIAWLSRTKKEEANHET